MLSLGYYPFRGFYVTLDKGKHLSDKQTDMKVAKKLH